MENKLTVRNLRVSFRTSNGKVQAVRGINFDLIKGETLAIVGESGSGKSVTSKAILGILAGNAIVESGEILYDGRDLLKISEEEFHEIRGDKIAMIFQDPMSSLNPIVRIGRQLTEAMLLKGKARQRESRANFNGYLKNLNRAMVEAAGNGEAARMNESCRKFDKFEFKHIELEAAYKSAHEAAAETVEDIAKIAFEMEKNAVGKDANDRIADIARQARSSINEYVVPTLNKAKIHALAGGLPGALRKARRAGNYSEVLQSLYELRDIIAELLSPDQGLDRLVINTSRVDTVTVVGTAIHALAGATLARIANAAQRAGLTGLEFAHGIPGTVGGGIYMNAGAYGGELKDAAIWTEALLPDGTLWRAEGEDQGFCYRNSAFQRRGAVILRAAFRLTPGDPDAIAETMRDLSQRRRASQPLDLPSAGSTFKRPQSGYAAALIEGAGLKGKGVGAAAVSEKHAGFVVNLGGATEADVLATMELVRQTVLEQSGVTLEPEVRLWGMETEEPSCNL